MAKDIYITGVIAPDELKQDEKLIGQNESYSYQDLINDIGEETEGTVYINSIGGMVEEGMLMYELLNKLNFNTVALSASSIASVVFLAGKQRKVARNAQMIIHNAWMHGEEVGDLTLNANTLEALKQEFDKMDGEIIAIYEEKTKLSASKLLALMAVDTDIASQAVELGFANGYYEEDKKPARAMNKFIMFNLKSVEMATEKQEERLTAIEKILNKISRYATAAFFGVNQITESVVDGPELYVFSDNDDYVGKRVVVSENGEPTEQVAPVGTHELVSGKTIVVGEGGIISEVKAAPVAASMDDERDEAIAKLEEEKMALVNAKTEMEEKMNAMAKAKESGEATFKAKIEEIMKEVKALKSETIGVIEDKKPKAMTQADFAKLTPSEKFRQNLMAKAK
jgi:ATP-dependent protease ClpP protease subunit